jgi:large subunit ribosomal protein L20
MTRVKRGNIARKRRNKILQISSNFRGSSSKLFRTANQQAMKALRYAYRDRLRRKRDFRSLWITRINAAVRFSGQNYNKFISTVKKEKMDLNRKMLSQLAIYDQSNFHTFANKLNSLWE